MAYGLLDGNEQQVPLKRIECTGEITDEFGVFTLKQEYQNGTDDYLNVSYLFPLSDSVVITDFSAELDGGTIQSQLMERQQAMERYANSNAVLLQQSGNGVFRVQIGGLAPQKKVSVTITYLKKTVREQERSRIIIPTVVAPRYTTYGQTVHLDAMYGPASYQVELHLVYYNSGVTNVTSPSHQIIPQYGSEKVEVFLKHAAHADRDIVIDFYTVPSPHPRLFRYRDLLYCTFGADFDVYRRPGRKYLFLLDVSGSMAGEKLRQAKNALLVCLRALQKGDRFNIMAFETGNSTLFDECLPLNDDTLSAATKWIQAFEPKGGTELMRPLMEACRQGQHTVALLFTDGQITGSDDILAYVRRQQGISFYTFGIDSAVNEGFLEQLAVITGGTAQFITPTERVDDSIVSAFDTIAAPSLEHAVIRFDGPVQTITPKTFRRIHSGQVCAVMAQCPSGGVPSKLVIQGLLAGEERTVELPLPRPTEAGRELMDWFGKEQIEQLTAQLMYDDSHRDQLLKEQIVALSLQYHVHCKWTAFVLTNSKTKSTQAVDVSVPVQLPYGWYQASAAGQLRDAAAHTREQERFLTLAVSQRANGSFLPPDGRRDKTAIDLYTAQVLHDFAANCPDGNMYRWQLRKAAAYLLNAIEEGAYGELPRQIVNALALWRKAYGVTDEISQKAEALLYVNGGIS